MCTGGRMEMENNIEVVSREAIKPSSPTPNHLRSFKLSFMDQHAVTMFTRFLLFYASSNNTMSADDKSRCLKKSLSEILTVYYPLAGRIKDLSSVDCNDDGALFIKARANGSTLERLLLKPDVSWFKTSCLFSPDLEGNHDHLLIIQATFFDCGGMSIGFSINHHIADGVAMSSFLKAWANAAVPPPLEVVVPPPPPPPCLLSASLLFPPLDPPPIYTPPTESLKKIFALYPKLVDCVSGRYVFSSSSIAELKTIAASKNVPNPTRVAVVLALIWKCRRMASRSRKSSMVSWPIDLRPSLDPPLPQHSFGNIITVMNSFKEGGDQEDLSRSVENTRKSVKEFREGWVKKLQGEGGFEVYMELRNAVEAKRRRGGGDIEMHTNNSWCRFGIYEADFGWGKPAWACQVPEIVAPGYNLLMDARDGDGIDARLGFGGEEEMNLFESNEELLKYASVNPAVVL